MRLWSLHPRCLDARGLVALWREGLLAQKALAGGAHGYRNHPQPERFRSHFAPSDAIASYLHAVCDEAERRGYRFDRSRLPERQPAADPIEVTDGQMEYELGHLLAKLRARNPERFAQLDTLALPEPHPSFVIVSGPIALWERPGLAHSQDLMR